MIRAQIQFTPQQHRRLKQLATRLGVSIAEVVRRCVSERLDRDDAVSSGADRVRETLSIIGKYAEPGGDGTSHVGRDHDEHLADAYKS